MCTGVSLKVNTAGRIESTVEMRRRLPIHKAAFSRQLEPGLGSNGGGCRSLARVVGLVYVARERERRKHLPVGGLGVSAPAWMMSRPSSSSRTGSSSTSTQLRRTDLARTAIRRVPGDDSRRTSTLSAAA